MLVSSDEIKRAVLDEYYSGGACADVPGLQVLDWMGSSIELATSARATAPNARLFSTLA